MRLNPSFEATELENLDQGEEIRLLKDWFVIEAMFSDEKIAFVVTQNNLFLSFVHRVGRDRKVYTPIQRLGRLE